MFSDPLNLKNKLLTVGLFLCEPVVSATEKQTILGSSNFIFYIIWGCHIKLLTKVRTNDLCTATHKGIPVNYIIWIEFLVREL